MVGDREVSKEPFAKDVVSIRSIILGNQQEESQRGHKEGEALAKKPTIWNGAHVSGSTL